MQTYSHCYIVTVQSETILDFSYVLQGTNSAKVSSRKKSKSVICEIPKSCQSAIKFPFSDTIFRLKKMRIYLLF